MWVCVISDGGIGEEEMTGEEVEIGGEEVVDEKTLSKRDIHTLNEQRRRDIIKVWRQLMKYLTNTVSSSMVMLC